MKESIDKQYIIKPSNECTDEESVLIKDFEDYPSAENVAIALVTHRITNLKKVMSTNQEKFDKLINDRGDVESIIELYTKIKDDQTILKTLNNNLSHYTDIKTDKRDNIIITIAMIIFTILLLVLLYYAIPKSKI
jgi:hypothetical protein